MKPSTITFIIVFFGLVKLYGACAFLWIFAMKGDIPGHPLLQLETPARFGEAMFLFGIALMFRKLTMPKPEKSAP